MRALTSALALTTGLAAAGVDAATIYPLDRATIMAGSDRKSVV